MKISEHIYAKRILFNAETPAGVMKRNVFVYVITGSNENVLIDSGVASSTDSVLELIEEAGLKPDDIDRILLTHAHVDHIGGAALLKDKCNCTVWSSEISRPWIENIDLQFKERPVPQFYDFVKESVTPDGILAMGDVIELGGSTIEVLSLPGHEKGQLGYFHREDGVLITGDSVPVVGAVPIYDSVSDELTSLRRLASVKGVDTMLLSWDDVHKGPEAYRKKLEDAVSYVKRIQELTREGIDKYGDDTDNVAKHIHSGLGLPASTFNVLFQHTVEAHMRERDIDPEDISL